MKYNINGSKKTKPDLRSKSSKENNQKYSFQNVKSSFEVIKKDLNKPKLTISLIQPKQQIDNNTTISNFLKGDITNASNLPIQVSQYFSSSRNCWQASVFNKAGVIDEDGMILMGNIWGIDIYSHLFLSSF